MKTDSMKPFRLQILFLAWNLSFFAGCGSVAIGTALGTSETQKKPENSFTQKSLAPFPEINCALPMKTLSEIAKWQEENQVALSQLKDPGLIENEVRLTSAGLLPDDLPFIQVDRDCWADFYEAFSGKLRISSAPRSKDEIHEAAEAWLACLEAKNPDLIEEAKKIRACFP
jgi:hypothetical protein